MTLEDSETGRRELASAVKRLRVAATSDPQRADDLADALVELTAGRLLAWDFAEAATDAPESVVLSARLLASRGPSGPYASVPDAVRYFTATALLAAVQAGLGQAEAAGRTLDGLDAWRAQGSRLPLAENLPAEVVVWALLARARAVLDADPASANAWADAAEQRLHGMTDPAPYLAIAAHLAVADARWAAGRPDSSLAHHRLALAAHADAVAGLGRTTRPAVRRMAAAPVPALHEPYAQRLDASGDRTGGIAVRRAEVTLLERFGDDEFLPPARAGLADALAAAGRETEAEAERAEAEARGPVSHRPVSAPPPGPQLAWEALPASATLAPAEDPDAVTRWQRAEQSAVFAGVAARADAERSEAVLRERAEADAAERAAAQAEAERVAEAEADAARAEQAAARREEAARAAERSAREEETARAAAEERRRLLAEEHRPDVDPDVALAAAAELDRARDAVRIAGDDAARVAAAREWLADVLRPLAAADASLRPELAASLEALVGLRWRLGDAEGSRAAAREAKALG
ncbi:MAG: hypothetical protein QM779_14240 [Propionicimonas sp.]|uniref:hypothetical protein n=1 Tax=Propionicimonas sp. TaxID=1955623 RepID=UPI003D1534E5